MERKHIDKMTKADMACELDNLRDDYDRLEAIQYITNMLNRLATTSDLEKVKNCVDRVYKETVSQKWAHLYGFRDNVCDMANNLAKSYNADALDYMNHFMYCKLLYNYPEATEGLRTVTKDMEVALLHHLQEQQKGGVA